jgi:hypothetical protein
MKTKNIKFKEIRYIILLLCVVLFSIFIYENCIRIKNIYNSPIILLFPSWYGKYNYVFDEIYPTKITDDDIKNIIEIVNNALYDYNNSQEERIEVYNERNPNLIIDKNGFLVDKFEMFVVQGIAIKNKNGEKEIWLNCIHKNELDDFLNWKHKILIIGDGGPYFFQIKINLTKKYYELQVNGYA